MSKSKETKEDASPFGGFNLLKGQFPTPPTEDTEESLDDVKAGDDTIIEDSEELSRIEVGNKALEEQERKKIEIASKKAIKESAQEQEESENETEETEEETEDASLLKVFTKKLYENSVLDFDDTDEDYEDNEKGVEKLVNKTVENRINKWVSNLPDEYQKFLEFVQNGGRPKDFLDVYYGNYSWENFSIDEESSQKQVVAEALRLAGDSEDDIAEMVEEWSENGTLSKRAKSFLPKLQKNEANQKRSMLEQASAQKQMQDQANKDYWDGFKSDLFKKEEVMGFKLTPKLKEKVWNHLTSVDPRSGKTAYQESVEKNKDAIILFALQSATGFDKSALETQVKTKVSKEFNNLLKNYSKSTKEKISSGITNEDYDTNPFTAFKNSK